ncbi:MAG: hydrolase [Ruminococcaceae bacterium]|nr:hydrolase [Oscillospiraceae bacterium]
MTNKSMVLMAALAVLLALTPRPAATVVSSVEMADKLIALTFDDGPDPVCTGRILDALEREGAKGTFFVIGEKLARNGALISWMAQGGHQIGSHTWSHADLSVLSAGDVLRELSPVIDALRRMTGQETFYVRPPYGFVSDTLRQTSGAPLVCWSVDPRDWECQDAEAVTAHVLSHVRDGDIVLLHDIYPSTAEAVESLVPALRERGFRMVTVRQLLLARGIQAIPGGVYFSAPKAGPQTATPAVP